MQLVNSKETHEFTYPDVQDPKPVFVVKKLSYGEVSSIGDSISLVDDKNRIMYLGGTSSRLKIKYSLVSWRNVTDETGKEAVCNDVNKDKLPPDVANWLVRQIDKLNGLSGIPDEESKN